MNSFVLMLMVLTCFHLLGDFYLQPESWIQDKFKNKAKSSKLLLHSLLHAVLATICVAFFKPELLILSSVFVFVLATHWLIDLSKICLGGGPTLFVLDQLMHFVVLAIVAVNISGLYINVDGVFTTLLTTKNVAIIVAYLIILKPVSIFIWLVLKNLPLEESQNKGLMSGGEMIGYVERILILTFILIGQYAVVGFVLAAKSIFRFGELSKSKHLGLTEYVLLGSLLSVTVTSLIGIVLKGFML